MSYKTQPRWKLNNSGLTLVEILVSITVFAIMLFPMLIGFNSLLKQNKTAKVTQAEADYAARIMEQFKQNDDIVKDYDDVSELTKLGFQAHTEDEGLGILRYTKDNIVLGGDFNDTIRDQYGLSSDAMRSTYVGSGANETLYNVEVTLDSGAYASSNSTAGGIIYDYQNPNDTLDYHLDNIDERFAVLIRDTVMNYDTRATTDLVDKAAKILKETDERRYNMWLNGVVNVFMNAKYSKNTYIKIDKNTQGDYVVDVTVNYSLYGYNNVDVSYNIIRDKVFKASTTNNKPPTVYYFYNQFTQNNMVLLDSESITLDNSGMVDGTGKVPEKDAIKMYIIKPEVKSNTTLTEYTRKNDDANVHNEEFSGDTYTIASTDGSGTETYDGHITTSNIMGSQVDTVELGSKRYYKWPSYVYTLSGMPIGASFEEVTTSNEVKALSRKLNRDVPTTVIREKISGNATGKYYIIYDNVLVKEGMQGAEPDSSLYDCQKASGDYTYVCRRKTEYNGIADYFQKGDIIYRNQDRRYVLPDGTVIKEAQQTAFEDVLKEWVNNRRFVVAKSEKTAYVNKPINIALAGGSSIETTDSTKKAYTIYTNIKGDIPPNIKNESQFIEDPGSYSGYDYEEYLVDKCNTYYSSFFESKVPEKVLPSKQVMPGTAGNPAVLVSSWVEFPDVAKCIRPLSVDAEMGASNKKLYRITLKLMRKKPDESDFSTVIELVSGKEG